MFQALLTEILEAAIHPTLHLVVHDGRNADPTWLCERLQERGDIDTITVDIAVLDDNVAEIDADAKLDALVFRDGAVPLCCTLLHRNGTRDSFNNTRKLDQDAVTGRP